MLLDFSVLSWRLLYFSGAHFYRYKAGLGSGTNNMAELMELKLQFSLVWEKQCIFLHCIGVSSLVINSMNGRCQLQDYTIIPSGDQLIVLSLLLNFFHTLIFTAN